MIMFRTYFSWDMTSEEKKEYLKQHPLFKMSNRGLERRTHLYVLKQRKEVDGKEICEGYSCEAGYNLVSGELLLLTWLGCAIYAAYRVFKKK